MSRYMLTNHGRTLLRCQIASRCKRSRIVALLASAAALAFVTCTGTESGSASNDDAAPPDVSGLHEPPPAELVRAAEHIVRGLQGRVTLDDSIMADTVTLYISPEGGGASVFAPQRPAKLVAVVYDQWEW